MCGERVFCTPVVVSRTIDVMLLTISTTYKPATDLGFLLHKNPSRFQSFNLPFGRADVFYPEAEQDRCTAALLLDIDPIGLVRGKPGGPNTGGWLEAIRERPALCGVITPERGNRYRVPGARWPAPARIVRPWQSKPSRWRLGLKVVPSREGADLIRSLFPASGL